MRFLKIIFDFSDDDIPNPRMTLISGCLSIVPSLMLVRLVISEELKHTHTGLHFMVQMYANLDLELFIHRCYEQHSSNLKIA